MTSELPFVQSRYPFRNSSRHTFSPTAAPSETLGPDPAAQSGSAISAGQTITVPVSASSDSNETSITRSTQFGGKKHYHGDLKRHASQVKEGDVPRGELMHRSYNVANGMAAPQALNDAYGNYDDVRTDARTDYAGQTSEKYHDITRADTQDSLAVVRTISRVPGNNTYYEKDGLRTYGDGQDHLTEPPMTWKRFMIFVAMGFLWTASQIPLYLFGGVVAVIQEELGDGSRYVWILLAYVIPLASITPFVGPIADLIGRRNIALLGVMFLVIGSIVCATASSMNNFIAGQTFNGVGAGILELVSLAVAGESAPTAKRGIYIGGIIVTIFPYCPSVLYGQLVSASSSWRYIGLWTGLWAFVGGLLTALFYWPPRRANRGGLSKRQILSRIDYTGGVLSSVGLTLFIMGLTWGGNEYAWTSSHVLPVLVIGAVFIIAFGVWECFFVKYPMFPRRLGANPRALTTVLIITFASGANFFAVLVFWPTQYQFVYTSPVPGVSDPVQVGIGSLPVGFCIIGGSIIFSILISVFKGHIKWLMVASCVVMTAGTGSMAIGKIDNLNDLYAPLTFACLGVGAVIIPNQIIAGVICPDDLIGSITALTISVRFVGGAISYAIYYYVIRRNFLTHLDPIAGAIIEAGIIDPATAIAIVYDLAYDQRNALLKYSILADNITAATNIIHEGQVAFSLSYPTCYLVSIAFGGTAIVASLFLPDITKYMDNHIAVQYLDLPREERPSKGFSDNV